MWLEAYIAIGAIVGLVNLKKHAKWVANRRFTGPSFANGETLIDWMYWPNDPNSFHFIVAAVIYIPFWIIFWGIIIFIKIVDG